MRRPTPWLIYLAWAVSYVAAYWILGVRGYPRYVIPAHFVWITFAGLGLIAVLNGLIRWQRGPTVFVLFAIAAVSSFFMAGWPVHPLQYWCIIYFPSTLISGLIAGVFLTLLGWTGTRMRLGAAIVLITLLMSFQAIGTVRAASNYAGDFRAPAYLCVCNWLNKNVPAGASLAHMDVGYLGYYTNMNIVDSCALVTPSALPYFVMRRPDLFLRKFHPDYVLVFQGSFPDSTAGETDLGDFAYRRRATFNGPPGRAQLELYERCRRREEFELDSKDD